MIEAREYHHGGMMPVMVYVCGTCNQQIRLYEDEDPQHCGFCHRSVPVKHVHWRF